MTDSVGVELPVTLKEVEMEIRQTDHNKIKV